MKNEWRKSEKELYIPKDVPTKLTVDRQKFIMIRGKGNPNNIDFSERVGVLYTMSYAVRMMPKNGFTPEGYFEYTVYPLEGIWDLTEEGQKEKFLNKDELIYTIMIRQPDFVTEEVFKRALEISKKKKPHPYLEEVEFTEIEDGLCVQILHTGSYDDEPASFDKMKQFIKENGLCRKTFVHREIYLSDTRKVDRDNLKTTLRYFVQ